MNIKLSETQDAAIREVAELGYTMAKANTITSLEKKGLIVQTGATHHALTDAGREYLGLESEEVTAEVEENFHQKLMADVAELEEGLGEIRTEDVSHEELKSLLQGDPWKMGAAITADEPYLEFKDEPLADWELEALHGAVQADTFDHKMAPWEIELLGFGETLKWENTKVWDGLTAEEILADMDNRVPANRADKRRARKQDRRARKVLLDLIAS